MPAPLLSAPPQVACERRAPSPSAARLVAVIATIAAAAVACALAARALAPAAATPAGLAGSVALGTAAMVAVGSLAEWLIHRLLMHRRIRWLGLQVAFDLHHRAHHWIHYPPDLYLQEGVGYVPAFPPAPNQRAVTRRQRVGAVAAQVLFYGLFAVPLVAAAWFATANAPFALAVAATAAAIVALAIHVHDAVHCPGHSPLERFGWFWFLDRHHYVHHVDTQANTNFLLPLGDLLLGTLRRELRPDELKRWPTYAEARAVVHDPETGASRAA